MRLTSVLDLIGLLLLVACASWAAAALVAPWVAPGVAGVGALAVSWLIDRRVSR